MKFTFSFILLAISLVGSSQNLLTFSNDSLFYENAPVARIEKSGFGFKVSSFDGQNLISVSEGGYHFNNGKTAWPQKAVLSKEATVAVFNTHKLFTKGGLNSASVERFVRKYPVKQSVLPPLRTSPISKEEE